MLKRRVILLGLILFAAALVTTVPHASGQWNVLQQMDMEDVRDYNGVAFISPKVGWVVHIQC